MPTERETLVAFFELISVSASYSHLKNVYSSIKFLHKALTQPFIEEEFHVNTVLQAIKRKIARVPFQVLQITPKILSNMYNVIDPNKVSDLALWCSFSVAFYCLFRKANVDPRSIDNVDPHKELSRQKVSIIESDGLVLIYSNWSKTNQFMNRDAIIPLLSTEILLWNCFFI